MAGTRKLSIKVGDQDVLEAERLAEWRRMTPQERLDQYAQLLSIWWKDARGLKGTRRIVVIPRG